MTCDWSLVGGDPAPGDPAGIRTIAGRYAVVADDAQTAAVELRSVYERAEASFWEGDAADRFREELSGDVLDNLVKLERSFTTAECTLRTYASDLESLQATARDQLVEACDASADQADADRRTAERSAYESRLRAVERQQQAEVDRLRSEYTRLACGPPGNEAALDEIRRRYYEAQGCLASTSRAVADATRSVDAAQREAGTAADRLRRATAQVRAIKDERDDAVQRAIAGIDRAAAEGVANKSWWERAGEWVGDQIEKVIDLADLSELLGKISLILAVAAVIALLLTPLIGPAGPTLAVALFKASHAVEAAKLAVDGLRAARGDIGVGQVVIDGIVLFLAGKAASVVGGVAGRIFKTATGRVISNPVLGRRFAAGAQWFVRPRNLASVAGLAAAHVRPYPTSAARSTAIAAARSQMKSLDWPFRFPAGRVPAAGGRVFTPDLTASGARQLDDAVARMPGRIVDATVEGGAAFGGDAVGDALVEGYQDARIRQKRLDWRPVCTPCPP